MVEAARPVWVDLSSSDAAASREFYSRLFGWQIEVSADPQYGGYGIAKVDGRDVAGIGPAQAPGQPTAWSIYLGTSDVNAFTEGVRAAGGSVVSPPFDVGDQGMMAVFQDPSGAFVSAWQPQAMAGAQAQGENSFGWAELSARGLDKAIPFYESVCGWTHRTTKTEGAPDYTEFLLDGESVAGAMEMNPMVPAEVPSYWMAYFLVSDVDDGFRRALDAGAEEMVSPRDFPGGRFAILRDPQGAAFGLLTAPAA